MKTKLNPPSTLLMGGAGVGKTTSIATLLQCGLKVRLLATESSSANRVIEAAHKRQIPLENFDWKFVSPAVPSWDSLLESARIVNTMSLKDIADLRSGIAKPSGRQWIELVNAMANFVSDKSGQALGDVTEWGPDCAFVIDSLSGVNAMSRNLTVGLKPNPSPGEWGTMQTNIMNLLWKLCSDCKCFFVCIAHVEREMNEITGAMNLTVSSLGAKIVTKIPTIFTNVVYAYRAQERFLWSTAHTGVDTKSGDLPLSDALPQDFRIIVDAYRNARNSAETQNTPQEKGAQNVRP